MPGTAGRATRGPVPDVNALARLRKNDAAWTKIARNARDGKIAPEFPLTDPQLREVQIWCDWWNHPVAEIWELAGAVYDVALAARLFAEAEKPRARTEDRKTLVQMLANLYLTADSQLRARIIITDDDGAITPVAPGDSNVTDLRRRLSSGAA